MFDSRQFKPGKPSEYTLQADHFLKKYEIKIDKQPFKWSSGRIVYQVIIYRDYADNARNVQNKILPISIEFTDSVFDSERKIWPSNYDILTCLTKNDPESHENFCKELGYDVDSIKAYKIWEEVVAEWKMVKRFFSENEILELQEIQ